MAILTGILAFIPLVVAIVSAYYFGIFVQKSLDVHNTLAVGIAMVAFGVLVWWLLVQYVLPAVGIMLGWDQIPYQP